MMNIWKKIVENTRKMFKFKEELNDDKGAITFVEASILIPMAILLIFFLLFISLLLEQQNFQRNRMMEYSLIPTTDKKYLEYENVMQKRDIQVYGSGLFLKTYNLKHENRISWGDVFRLFKIGSNTELTQDERLRNISKANNIWRYEAINAWLRMASKAFGGE